MGFRLSLAWQLGILVLLMSLVGASARADTRRIRLADCGWTDVTATTAVASEILRGLGIQTDIQVLSIPVAFMGLKTGDVDVFLGNWMPTQANDVKPYLAENAFVALAVNLQGALYTFAVPDYAQKAGVSSPVAAACAV